jgi:hypothetical protein
LLKGDEGADFRGHYKRRFNIAGVGERNYARCNMFAEVDRQVEVGN